jgi:hypothetical protein
VPFFFMSDMGWMVGAMCACLPSYFGGSLLIAEGAPDYPAKGSTWLLMGKPVNPDKPTAIDNPVAWTWQNAAGGKTFMTTMGHPEDFQQESVQHLAINAIHWTLGLPVPKKWAGKININVPYRGM